MSILESRLVDIRNKNPGREVFLLCETEDEARYVQRTIASCFLSRIGPDWAVRLLLKSEETQYIIDFGGVEGVVCFGIAFSSTTGLPYVDGWCYKSYYEGLNREVVPISEFVNPDIDFESTALDLKYLL